MNKLFNNKDKFFLLAGPCVIENEEIMCEVAETLKEITSELGIEYVFKASYKKANRTSIDSYTGVGIEKGLEILSNIKNRYNLPIVTDVHETHECAQVAQVADILQIPAFLSRQTDLLVSAGETGKYVNIKKAQFMAGEDVVSAAEKVLSTGNNKVLLTERGTCFGYHNLVVDYRNFAKMKSAGFPVIYDVTHSLQQPSIGKISGGTPELVPMMAKAAIATGMVDGLFIETHPNPQKGLSDAKSMFRLDQMKKLLSDCLKVWDSVRS